MQALLWIYLVGAIVTAALIFAAVVNVSLKSSANTNAPAILLCVVFWPLTLLAAMFAAITPEKP